MVCSVPLLVAATLALASAAPPAAAPLPKKEAAPQRDRRLALVLELSAKGVEPDLVDTLGELVASAVSRDRHLDVTSGADVKKLLDLASDRQTVGCDDATDGCLAEIAGAMGANVVVMGSVGRLGSTLVVSITIYDADRQSSVGRETVQADDVGRLSPLIEDAVARMLGLPLQVRGSHAALVPIGASVAGVGALAAVVGGSIAGWSVAVQGDKNSSGDDKQGAAAALTPAVVVGLLGVVTAVAGSGAAIVGSVE